MRKYIPRFWLLPLLMLVAVGCGTTKPGKPVAHAITVVMDSSLQGQRVLVDLVGVNPSQKRQWEEKSMTEYWGSADALRSSARKVTFEFTSPDKPQGIPAKDPIWKEWLGTGATEVLALADIPNLGRRDDKPGDADARRRVLPLDAKRWAKGTKELRIILKRGGLEVVSQQRVR
jgi:hypothetical protein